jgi:hypothetical protein
MIHTTPDFFNKVATEIRSNYFPTENHGTTENQNYHKANYAIECFNNGALTYRKLIGRLAKNCNATTQAIHLIVQNYIVSFGEYQYRPKKV